MPERSDVARILKRGRAREVRVEPAGDGAEAIVVKRFRHPEPWNALGDGRRARNEHALLALLSARGLAVPEPLGVRRVDHGWELCMRWIPGAHSLERWLDPARRGAAPPGGWAELLSRLARLLAGLLDAGVVHPDLHAGNVLVDPQGEPWLVDFHAARRRRVDLASARGRELLDASLVRWAALTRETLAARTRLGFLRAFRAALPEPARAALRASTADGQAFEQRARLLRRALVAHGVGRWLRDSSRVEVQAGSGTVRYVRRAALSGAEQTGVERELEPCVFELADRREAEARWRNAARLEEHGIPALVPLSLEHGARGSRLVLGRPPGALRLAAPTAAERGSALTALTALLGDRGLVLRRPAQVDVLRAPAGPLLGSVAELGDADLAVR